MNVRGHHMNGVKWCNCNIIDLRITYLRLGISVSVVYKSIEWLVDPLPEYNSCISSTEHNM